ncbi:co-chaperone GroES [Streptococcus sp. zg-JUN1979]|uniref:co-chaperone GroES n=1 Tax=Streptococcus sp. zg-JUN1979 TaxID=3391450 RepID=UPI0039B0D35B
MLKPLGDRVVLRVNEEKEQTIGGFVLAGAGDDKTKTATVVAVGGGTLTLNGDVVAPSVAVGDTVVFEAYAGVEVKDGEETLVIVREAEILAIQA